MVIDYDAVKKSIKDMRWPIGKETAARLIRRYHVHANKHPDDNSNNRTARKLEMHKIRTQNSVIVKSDDKDCKG